MNNTTRTIVGTVLEVVIGMKATALGRCRTFVVAGFYLGRGAMKAKKVELQYITVIVTKPVYQNEADME